MNSILILAQANMIDVSEQHELNYWCDKLGITPEVLKGAIRASKSNKLVHVIHYLKSCNKISHDHTVQN